MSDTDFARRPQRRRSKVSRLEFVAVACLVVALVVLVVIEPDIIEAPFASTPALVATAAGLLIMVVAFTTMIRLGVAPIVRLIATGAPLLAASWWLLQPYFVDDVVDEAFPGSITQQSAAATDPTQSPPDTTTPVAPQLLASGTFVGLAGHDGTGDAGIFRLADGGLVLRLENLDIDNGPDLELYLVPGSDAYSPVEGSIELGALKGNVGNQTYELPGTFSLAQGPWTVLVWCDAFSVEFVGATLTVA